MPRGRPRGASVAEECQASTESASSSINRTCTAPPSSPGRARFGRLVTVVLVAVQHGGGAVSAGVDSLGPGVPWVFDRLLDVLEGQRQLVAGYRDGGDAHHGDQDQDQREFDHRLALPPAVSSG